MINLHTLSIEKIIQIKSLKKKNYFSETFSLFSIFNYERIRMFMATQTIVKIIKK